MVMNVTIMIASALMSVKSTESTANRPFVDVGEGRPFTALGAHVERLVHPLTTGSQALGVSLCVMQPGDRVHRHHHPYEEAYFVVSGHGTMYLEGEAEPIMLLPGRAVYIAVDRVHGQVADQGEELHILCSLSPPPIEGQSPLFDDEPEVGP